ncbi:hypothetical protein FJTKL_07929 [Diaporthe vaccinii]|uniref:Uncharacterized protein n=1 Tax=Diaporthe vaccinii TaxID=105482 RepID=A0ABR4FDV4_9PEZI
MHVETAPQASCKEIKQAIYQKIKCRRVFIIISFPCQHPIHLFRHHIHIVVTLCRALCNKINKRVLLTHHIDEYSPSVVETICKGKYRRQGIQAERIKGIRTAK